MLMRPFNDNDWMSFAGAEPTDDGRQPMICETENEVIIVDNAGLNIFRTPSQTPMYQLEDAAQGEYHRVKLPYDIALGLACMLTPEAVRDWVVDNGEL